MAWGLLVHFVLHLCELPRGAISDPSRCQLCHVCVLADSCSSGTASAHPSAWRCDFQLGMNPASSVPSLVGSAGALPAMPHSTEKPFRNSFHIGLGSVEGERGEGCVNCL